MNDQAIPQVPHGPSQDQIKSLPLRLRIAYTASIVEKSLAFYSDYFVNHLLQRDAVDFAWDFAESGIDDSQRREALATKLDEQIEDDDDYDPATIAPSALLLEEIGLDDGLACANAIDYAARNYANARFYREGINPCAAITEVDHDACASPFYDMAMIAFHHAKSLNIDSINRNMLDDYHVPFDPIPDRLRVVNGFAPPRRESEKWGRRDTASSVDGS